MMYVPVISRIDPPWLQRTPVGHTGVVPWLLFVALFILTRLTSSETTTDTRLELAEKATGFVEIWINDEFVASGSCFCFDNQGYFITNNHVVNWSGLAPVIFVVMNSGTKTEQRFPATVVKTSADLDLAVLQVKSEKAFPFIKLAANPAVTETQTVTAIGFPRGRDKSKRSDLNPPVTVTQGKITALQKVDGVLKRVQFNADVDHGSSGGPLLNNAGEVIGAVVAGYVGHDINMAIPVEQILAYLNKPELSLTPEFLTPQQLGTQVNINAHISALYQSSETFEIKMIISGAPGTPDRSFNLNRAAGEFKSQISIPSSAELSSRVEVELEFDDGTIRGTMDNLPITVMDRKLFLSQTVLVQQIQPCQVVLEQGGAIPGAIQPLGLTPVQVGPQKLTLDLSKARSIKCLTANDTTNLHYRLQAFQKGVCVAEIQRDLPIRFEAPRLRFVNISGSNPAVGEQGHIRPPPAAALGIVALPDRIHDMATAGGGRYLLMHFPSRKSIAIFDVNLAKIVKELRFTDPDLLFAGGTDCLVVYSPVSHTLERWSLLTYQQTNKKELGKDREVKAIVMGCGSAGPLMVCSARKGDEHSSADFLDISDFSVTRSVDPAKWGMGNYQSIHLRASANGKTFSSWCTQITPFGLHILRLTDQGITYGYDFCDVGWILPAADGGRVHVFDTYYYLNHCGRLFGPDNKELQWSVNKDSFVVPAQRGDFCLAIDGRTRREMTLYRDGATTPLAHLGIRYATIYNSYLKGDFWIDKKLYLIPDAELLITVLNTDRHLLLQPISFSAILNRESELTGKPLPPTTQDPKP